MDLSKSERKALKSKLAIRPIAAVDNAGMAQVIREVMTEFGAIGAGFSIEDPEVDGMFEAYSGQGHCFNVVVDGDRVLAGAGIAPLAGGEAGVCELRKMYAVSLCRGVGVGHDLLERCIAQAKQLGFDRCYLETLDSMRGARKLYQSFGFEDLNGPMGETGHGSCDRWMILDM